MKLAKERLQKEHGSLRAAAKHFNINYYRLANCLNGWIKFKPEEIEMLKLTKEELAEMGSVYDTK